MSDSQAETAPRQYHANHSMEEWQANIAAWAHDKGWWGGFPGGDIALLIERQRDTQRVSGGLRNPANVEHPDANYIAAKLALIHSEVSEGLEALRDGDLALRIDPERGKPEGLESELADIIIRTLDLAEALGMDMGTTMAVKMAYNEGRPHKHGNRKL